MSDSEAPKAEEGVDVFDCCRKLQNPHAAEAIAAAKTLRVELSKVKANIDLCVKAGAIPVLVQALMDTTITEYSYLLDLSWALTNIASGTSEHTQAVVNGGGVDAFMRCIDPKMNPEIVVQGVWGLGNIAGESASMRDYVSTKLIPALPAICPILTTTAHIQNLSWTLSNLVRAKPAPSRDVILPLLPLVVTIMKQTEDQETLVNCLWHLSYHSDGPNNRIQDVLDTGVVPILVEKLKGQAPKHLVADLSRVERSHDYVQTTAKVNADCISKILEYVPSGKLYNELVFACKDWFYDIVAYNPHLFNKALKPEFQADIVVTPALRTIGNIVTGDDNQTQQVLSIPNVLGFIQSLLHHPKRGIRKESAWTLSNIAAGNRAQIQFLIDEPSMLDNIIHCLYKDHKDVVKELCWVISNMFAGGSNEQYASLIHSGCVVAMLSGGISALTMSKDTKLLQVVLEGLEHTYRLMSSWEPIEGPFPDLAMITDGHGFARTFLPDDESPLRASLYAQMRSFHLIPKLLGVARSIKSSSIDMRSHYSNWKMTKEERGLWLTKQERRNLAVFEGESVDVTSGGDGDVEVNPDDGGDEDENEEEEEDDNNDDDGSQKF